MLVRGLSMPPGGAAGKVPPAEQEPAPVAGRPAVGEDPLAYQAGQVVRVIAGLLGSLLQVQDLILVPEEGVLGVLQDRVEEGDGIDALVVAAELLLLGPPLGEKLIDVHDQTPGGESDTRCCGLSAVGLFRGEQRSGGANYGLTISP